MTGRAVPAIGQGTWNVPASGAARVEAVRTLRRGIELGMTHIDTAEMYGNGASEELIADAIDGVPRESLFLVSKVLPSNASYEGTIRACERSLRRLRTPYLDTYLLHWRGGEPLEDTMRALERLVDDGKIRALGVSNFDVADLREAQTYLRTHAIACDQVLYNLKERTIEAAESPYARENDMAIVGYTPFDRARSNGTIESIASAHHVGVHAVVLAFLTRDAGTFAIPKASTVAHVEENAQAADLALDPGEIAAIDRAYPARPRRGALPMG